MTPISLFNNFPKLASAFGTLILAAQVHSANPATAEPGTSLSEPEATAGSAVVRRLTESQYRASIADIFSPDIPVVGRFEPGLRSEGLIAVGTSEAGLSRFSVEQYSVSASGIAAAVTSEEFRDILPCQAKADDEFSDRCAKKIISHYGSLLFRRPLDKSEQESYLQLTSNAFDKLGTFYEAIEYGLTALLVAPDFLLRMERVIEDPENPGQYRLDPYSVAERLSFFLTGSSPDAELLNAAKKGKLNTAKGLEKQVERLLASPRYEHAVRDFFNDMLTFDAIEELSKDPIIYPAFNSDVVQDAKEQTLRTIVYHLLEQQGDYRDLFTLRDTFLSRDLGTIYRLPVAARDDWEQKTFSEQSERVGIQSHLSFLMLHSHPGRSSPTLRGVAIREIFLCQHMHDPPADVDFSGFNEANNMERPTARDRLEAHRTQPVCQGCHVLMDPLGLTLERFDGLGAFRTHENSRLIDVSGSLDGQQFEAASGLGAALHDYSQTPECLVKRMYGYAVGRDADSAERPYLNYLKKAFSDNGFNVPELMRTIALSDTFYSAKPLDKPQPLAANQ